MKILFMCVHNSARSQMAEGLAKKILGLEHHIESAGSQPAGVNPFAIKAMREIGIDIAEQYSKSCDDLPSGFVASLDYVITLCAEEVCPVVVSEAKKLHWPLPDPGGAGRTEEERLQKFREIRDEIRRRIESFWSQC